MKTRDLCFVDGAGIASNDRGVVVRCTDDDVEYTLPLPDAADSLLEFSIEHSQPTLFRFATDNRANPLLLATAVEESAVWFYPPLSQKFVEIPQPFDGKGPGRRASACSRRPASAPPGGCWPWGSRPPVAFGSSSPKTA
jgi:hypothetical protein